MNCGWHAGGWIWHILVYAILLAAGIGVIICIVYCYCVTNEIVQERRVKNAARRNLKEANSDKPDPPQVDTARPPPRFSMNDEPTDDDEKENLNAALLDEKKRNMNLELEIRILREQ